jgi:hypothetical protein
MSVLDFFSTKKTAPVVVSEVPHRLSRDNLRALVVAKFRQQGDVPLQTLHDVEHMPLQCLRAVKTSGTVLDVPAKAMEEAGIPTDGTVGSVMDVLGLSHDDIHNAFCWCVSGAEITGAQAAERFAGFA